MNVTNPSLGSQQSSQQPEQQLNQQSEQQPDRPQEAQPGTPSHHDAYNTGATGNTYDFAVPRAEGNAEGDRGYYRQSDQPQQYPDMSQTGPHAGPGANSPVGPRTASAAIPPKQHRGISGRTMALIAGLSLACGLLGGVSGGLVMNAAGGSSGGSSQQMPGSEGRGQLPGGQAGGGQQLGGQSGSGQSDSGGSDSGQSNDLSESSGSMNL